MSAMMNVNLAVRFILELCALAALGYWGFKTGGDWVARFSLGIGAPLLAAVVWGLGVAPKARLDLPAAVRLMLELAVFGAAIAALYTVGRSGLAAALAVAYAINRGVLALWGD